MDQGKSQEQPAEKPEAEQEPFRFPPVTNQTIITQNPITGDVWLGFNPARFPRLVVLAWAAFQVESVYAQFMAAIQAQQQAAEKIGRNGKRGILDILRGVPKS